MNGWVWSCAAPSTTGGKCRTVQRHLDQPHLGSMLRASVEDYPWIAFDLSPPRNGSTSWYGPQVKCAGPIAMS